MKAYIQLANGQELELTVKEPDPIDGTFCAFVPDDVKIKIVLASDGESWIRICPNEV